MSFKNITSIMKRFYFLLSALFFLTFTSCGSDSDTVVDEISNLSAEKFNTGSDETSLSLNFISPNPFYVKASDWIKVSPDHGEGGGQCEVKFTVAANKTPDERSGYITITSGEVHKTVTVIQSQKDTFEMEIDKYDIAPEGGKLTIDFKSNFIPECEINVPWITMSEETASRAMEDGHLTFNIELNNTYSERTGSIVLSSSNGVKKEITISQARRYELYFPLLSKQSSPADIQKYEKERGNSFKEKTSSKYGVAYVFEVSEPDNSISNEVAYVYMGASIATYTSATSFLVEQGSFDDFVARKYDKCLNACGFVFKQEQGGKIIYVNKSLNMQIVASRFPNNTTKLVFEFLREAVPVDDLPEGSIEQGSLAPAGVYVAFVHKGKKYAAPYDKYTIKTKAFGALVSDGEHQIIVSPRETPMGGLKWSEPSDVLISGCYLANGDTDEEKLKDAMTDFNGMDNTMALMNWVREDKDSRKAEPAVQALAYIYGGVKGWWIPSVAELDMIMMRESEINQVFTKCRSHLPIDHRSDVYWSSTQYSNDAVFVWSGDNGIVKCGKSSTADVRPVTKF